MGRSHVRIFIAFAVTITVGIATSMFTATMVARLMMVRWYAARRPQLLPV